MTSINIISVLGPSAQLENVTRPNMVYAWFLDRWLTKMGVDSRFVNHAFYKPIRIRNLKKAGLSPQVADHTLITSRGGYSRILGVSGYYKKIRKLTRGKLVLYLCSDLSSGRYAHLTKYFDHVFTMVHPRKRLSSKYVYAGWGADPEYCYPEKTEKAIYLDCLMYGYYGGRHDYIYDIYDKTIPKLELKLHHPFPRYKGTPKMGWPEHQKLIRASHFYCLTQPGEGGLTRIEAAMGGALLVVPNSFSRLRIISDVECKSWEDEGDLIEILESTPDVQAIRKTALKHTWENVAQRIIKVLEEG